MEQRVIVIKELMTLLMSQFTNPDVYQSAYFSLKEMNKFFRNENVYSNHEQQPDFEFKTGGLSIFEMMMHIAPKVDGVNAREFAQLIYEFEKFGLVMREDPSSMPMKKFIREDQIRFKISAKGALYHTDGLVENLILGFPYIIKKYRDSVVQVIGKLNSEPTLGTGFLVGTSKTKFVVTCRHNIEGITELRFVIGDRTITEYKVTEHDANDIDCEIIAIDAPELEPFVLSNEHSQLENVITMGFPKIPLSDQPYLMIHKGEVNGTIKDYLNHQERIIFSAKTSSGNSGSPLISESGTVIGMVSNELFDKGQLVETGKLPYYSAIPIKTITEFYNIRGKSD